MTKLVQLTKYGSGTKVWVNPDQVTAIEEDVNFTTKIFTNDNRFFSVDSRPEDVVAKLAN